MAEGKGGHEGGGERRWVPWVVGAIGMAALGLLFLLRPLGAAADSLVQSGMPRFQVVFPLFIPVIAFLIVVWRNVIGLDTFGIFTPALLAVAFLTTGFLVGLLLFGLLLAIGSAVRLLFERHPILAFSRLSAVLSVVALVTFALMYLGSVSGIGSLVEASALPVVILTLVIERFVALQVDEGPREAMRLTLLTVAVAFMVYLILDTQFFQSWLLAVPELSLAALAGTLLLGRWTGLRLTEYWRFREVGWRGVR